MKVLPRPIHNPSVPGQKLHKEDLQREIMGQDLGKDRARKRLFHIGVIIRCCFPVPRHSNTVNTTTHLDMFRLAEISGVI